MGWKTNREVFAVSITINSNVASLNAQRRLRDSTAAVGNSFQRLSSGLRIDHASDDAAGLAIASSLNVDTKLTVQARRNTNDAISALSIASGSVDQLSAIITRITELSEQAANGVLGAAQRRALDAEAQALRHEHNRIVATTSFNGLSLLSPATASIGVQVGISAAQSLAIGLSSGLVRQAGDGSFLAGQVITWAGNQPNETAVADLNSDGADDFVIGDHPGGGGIKVALSNSDGTFRLSNFANAQRAEAVYLFDFNNDGILDIGASETAAAVFQIFTGNGNGTFNAPANIGMPGGGTSSAMADFNGDGHFDFILSSPNSYSVHLGNGNATFRALAPVTTALTNIFNTETADLNGDGKLDLIHTYGPYVSFGNGDGTFKSASSYWPGGAASEMKAGDYNGDGNIDVGVAYQSSILVYIGNSNGTLKAPLAYATGFANSGGLSRRDLNEDGVADFITPADSRC